MVACVDAGCAPGAEVMLSFTDPDACAILVSSLLEKQAYDLLFSSWLILFDHLQESKRQEALQRIYMAYQEGHLRKFHYSNINPAIPLGNALAVFPSDHSLEQIKSLLESHPSEPLILDYLVVCYKQGHQLSKTELDMIFKILRSSKIAYEYTYAFVALSSEDRDTAKTAMRKTFPFLGDSFEYYFDTEQLKNWVQANFSAIRMN